MSLIMRGEVFVKFTCTCRILRQIIEISISPKRFINNNKKILYGNINNKILYSNINNNKILYGNNK